MYVYICMYVCVCIVEPGRRGRDGSAELLHQQQKHHHGPARPIQGSAGPAS